MLDCQGLVTLYHKIFRGNEYKTQRIKGFVISQY